MSSSQKALGAVKHSIICIIWHMLATGELYTDLGGDYFRKRDPEHIAKQLIAQLENLGQKVTLEELPHRTPESRAALATQRLSSCQMTSATRLCDVAGEATAGAAELVVERHGGSERGEAGTQADAEVVEGAGAVAFEREDVLAGSEDRFDPLADRREVRPR